jgi:hypothetical protein
MAARLTALSGPAHYLSLAVGLAVLLYLDRHTWFFNDEFAFFARIQPGQSLGLLVPYQEQWSTLPLLITLGLYRLVGLHSVLPYTLWMVGVQLGVAHLLWRWMRRVGADPWVATALAAVFLVVGGGVEDLSIWAEVSFAMPVALGLLGALLVDHDGGGAGRDIAFWPIAVAGLMCSDIGVFMVVLVGLVALLRRGPRAGLRVVSVPALVFLVWLALIAHGVASSTPIAASDLPLLPQYAWVGISSAIDNTTGWTGAGGALALALAGWLFLLRREARGPQALAFAGVMTAPIFFVGAGVARVAAGTSQASSTRYGYVCIALLLPAAALALSRICQRAPVAGRALVAGASAIWVVNGVASLVGVLQFLSPLSGAAQSTTLGAARLLAESAPLAVGNGASVAPWAPGLTVSALRSIIQAGAWPTNLPVTDQDLLDAAAYLQVSVTPTPLTPSGTPPSVLPEFRPLVSSDGGGCLSLASLGGQPEVGLSFASSGWVEIVAAQSGEASVQLAWATAPGALTAAQPEALPAGSSYLNVTAAGTIAMLTLPTGSERLCGVSMTGTTISSAP